MKPSILFITIIILIALITGCSMQGFTSNEPELIRSASVKSDNATMFNYRDIDYIILEDTVSRNELGKWIGYIQTITVIDNNKRVIEHFSFDQDGIDQAFSLSTEQGYNVIRYNNIYETLDSNDDKLVVDINDTFHKAVKRTNLRASNRVIALVKIDFKGSIRVNPDDFTQILVGDKKYQVTRDSINERMIKDFLGYVGQPYMLLTELSQEFFIDIYSTQSHSRWLYSTVYTLEGYDPNYTIGVLINNRLYRADIAR